MRIVNKPSPISQKLCFAMALLTMVGSISATANAADAVPPPALPVVTTPAPVLAPASPSALTLPALSPLAADPTKQSSTDMNKAVSAMEEKVTNNAKGVMNKLDNTNEPLMLEDLNTARQTVARIEAMIDIEKHLVELDKLRADHGKGASSLANAIPASALEHAPMPPKAMEPIHRAASESDIVRIIGVDGKYEAVLKSPEGNKTVHVGEKLSNGATVRLITASSVVIDDNGTEHTMRIKNADSIFSAMR